MVKQPVKYLPLPHAFQNFFKKCYKVTISYFVLFFSQHFGQNVTFKILSKSTTQNLTNLKQYVLQLVL